MAVRPQIAVILSTFERPWHLRRSLASLALQRGVDGEFEVVVTDDGSQDETPVVVHEFADRADFPVTFTTHEHKGFRLARCRNDGVRASRAAYLLFSDGDCIFPPDFVRQHLAARRVGLARSGDCVQLDRHASSRLDQAAIADVAYRTWVTAAERRRLTRRWIRDCVYHAVGHPSKPKLKGCNIGAWRCDLERINGFDERFVGWGCEDDDLGRRLRQSGVRIASMLGYTWVYHLWHPVDPSRAPTWRGGANVPYLLRPNVPTRCTYGLSNPDSSESIEAAPAFRRVEQTPLRGRSAA